MLVGHWKLPENISENQLKNSSAFVYKAVCKESDLFYIGFKSIKKQNGEDKPESTWLYYKTSSKLVKWYINEGYSFDFYIIDIKDTIKEATDLEEKLLLEVDALKNEKCLNQRITHEQMVRRPESYTEEALENLREGVRKWVNSDEYVHPLKGKTHPNKGKKLPQTGHDKNRGLVSITDGTTNRRQQKDDPLPEGFWYGMTIRNKTKSEKQLESFQKVLEQLSEKAREKREKYYNDPILCPNCGEPIEFKKRKINKYCCKKCSGEGRSKKL